MEDERRLIYTIGHSTLPLNDFIAVLKQYEITLLVDIRHFPMSRKNPQFNREVLERSLPERGIAYQWMESLGGFRTGGYEAYMATQEFSDGLDQLIDSIGENRAAIMCAELLWFKCHRRFVADRLMARGLPVIHIFDQKRTQIHNPERRQRKMYCDRPLKAE